MYTVPVLKVLLKILLCLDVNVHGPARVVPQLHAHLLPRQRQCSGAVQPHIHVGVVVEGGAEGLGLRAQAGAGGAVRQGVLRGGLTRG
jgi:hypothetical protein